MFIKKLFLPRLPDNIINEVYKSIETGINRVEIPEGASKDEFNMYAWIPANDAVQNWCISNISPDLYWGVQVIDKDLPMHKDNTTELKFNYIIDQGSVDAKTNYYDDAKILLDSYVLEKHSWYILNVRAFHEVTGLKHGGKRVSITSRLLP